MWQWEACDELVMSADGGKEAVAADGAFGAYVRGSRFGSHSVSIGFERAGLCVIE